MKVREMQVAKLLNTFYMLTVVEINDIFTDRNFLALCLCDITMFLQIIYRQHQVIFISKLQETLQPYV